MYILLAIRVEAPLFWVLHIYADMVPAPKSLQYNLSQDTINEREGRRMKITVI